MPPPLPPLPTPPRRTRTRLILGILAIVLLPFLACLVWYVSYRISNTRAISRLEAKARASGEPLTLAALAARYPPIGDEENAAVPLLALWQQEEPAFWQAFLSGRQPLPQKATPKLDDNLPVLGPKHAALSRTNALPPASIAAAEAYCREHAEHREAVRAALQRPRFRFPIRITDGFATLLPHLSLLTVEAKGFHLATIVAAERNDAEAGIAAITNAARLGQLLANEPLLISQLTRLGCLHQAIEGTQYLLSRRALTEPHLARLETVFRSLQLTGSLRFLFTSERASALNVYTLSARELASVADTGEESVPPQTYAAGIQVLTAIGLVGADKRLMLETFDKALALADEDTPEALRRYEALFDETAAKSRRFPPKMFSSLLLSAYRNVPTRFAAFEARRRALLAALAVERHRQSNDSALPEKLSQLQRQPLSVVPLDPFDGQPLRYRKLESGYVIYSIGSDRSDDGGQDRAGNRQAKGRDETFRVKR